MALVSVNQSKDPDCIIFFLTSWGHRVLWPAFMFFEKYCHSWSYFIYLPSFIIILVILQRISVSCRNFFKIWFCTSGAVTLSASFRLIPISPLHLTTLEDCVVLFLCVYILNTFPNSLSDAHLIHVVVVVVVVGVVVIVVVVVNR